jgi:cyclophilin family peptidyl-prolyl cis-trans isomerase
MASEQPIVAGVAGRYATALFDLALEEKLLDKVRANLDRFEQLVAGSDDLQRLVRSPVFSADQQVKALQPILQKSGIDGIAANFIKLVGEGFYDSLLFHRVIKDFMIQGGDPQSKNAAAGQPLGMGDVGYKIPAEIVDTLFHKKGVLAAARDGNPQKASSGCQFYIVQGKVMSEEEMNMAETRMGMKFSEAQRKAYSTVGGTPWLDKNYTVFGELIEGLDVLDKIAAEGMESLTPAERLLLDEWSKRLRDLS